MKTLPRKIGGYTLLDKIGDGGQAEVYRARQESTGQIVAVKLLDLGQVFSSVAESRFRGDMESLGALGHASIVPLIDYVEQEGSLRLLVMKYVDGGDLSARIEAKAPESPKAVLRVVEQVGGALAEAHAHGILHRDVKPGNVLVDRQGHCLLTDFGIAKRQSESAGITKEGTSIGTVLYMSPEQGQGKAIDGRSDLYALAAIAFEMLTGRRAFAGETYLEVTLNKEASAPSFVAEDNVAAELQSVLRKALDPRADKRQSTVTEFVEELREAVASGAESGGSNLRNTTLVQRSGRPSGGRAVKVGGALVLVAAAAAAGIMAMGPGEAPPEANVPGSSLTGGTQPASFEPGRRERKVFAEPALPQVDDSILGATEPVDVVLLLDEALERPSTMADVTREVLQPLAAELRAMEGIRSVSLPPVVTPIAGPNAVGLRRDLLDLNHDIAVVFGLERVRGADEELPGVTRRRTKIRPAVRVKAMLASSGAEAPFSMWQSVDPVLAAAGECGPDAETGVPSAVREASAEALAAVRADVATMVADLAARGREARFGIVAPENDRGVVARFERTLAEVPGLISKETLPLNDWTFQEDGAPFVRTSSATTRDQDAVAVNAASHMEFWSLRQRGEHARTVQFLRQSLEDWVQFDSARQDYEETWDQEPSDDQDALDAEQEAQSPGDLLDALGRDRPVELRYTIRVIVGSDLTLFEVRSLAPEEDVDDDSGSTGKTARASGDLRAVMTTMSGSVYLPVGVSADGTEAPLGSAWVVGDGMLATNGHVVASFEQFDRVVMRRVGEDGGLVEFEVKRHQAHPGYLELAQLGAQLSVLKPNTLEPAIADYHDVFDVALVWVEPHSGGFESLGPPFELATRDEVVGVERGVEVAYMGFPCEASSNMLNVSRPTPVGIRGSLTGAVDTTMGAANAEMSRILRVDVPLVGGASGSVVFRGDGKVVGLVNSGAVIGIQSGLAAGGLTRIAVSGFGYIQRIDTLTELIDGRAADVVAEHRASWTELLERDLERFESWVGERFVVGLDRGDGSTVRSAKLRRRAVLEVDVFTPSSKPGQASLASTVEGVEFTLKPGDNLVAVAISDPAPLITVGVYYSGAKSDAFVGEGLISRYSWSGADGSSAGFRGYRVIPEALIDQGIEPDDVGHQSIQVLLFDVE